METQGFSEAKMLFYQATRSQIQKDSSLHEIFRSQEMQEMPINDACQPEIFLVKMCVIKLQCMLKADKLSVMYCKVQCTSMGVI